MLYVLCIDYLDDLVQKYASHKSSRANCVRKRIQPGLSFSVSWMNLNANVHKMTQELYNNYISEMITELKNIYIPYSMVNKQ